jgi:DNA polymerase III alpha subunit (gram-positive type)
MITTNGNALCAIDVETTGLDPDIDQIWQLACIPVNYNLQVDKTRPILDLCIIPSNIDALSRRQTEYVRQNGIAHNTAVDLFHRWFASLGLASGRRIMPLAHNWKFDHAFLRKFLGDESFQEIFDGRHRDSLQVAIAINDAYEMAGLDVPFPKQNLSSLCTRLDIPLDNAHWAMEDANAMLLVYQRLVKRISEVI